MKLTVYAILLLAFMAGLTLVQVEMSNNDTPFQALSDTEMQATSGAGDCPAFGECLAGKDEFCGLQDCDRSISNWQAVKQVGAWHDCCSEEERSMTHDCVVDEDQMQACAVRYHYGSPLCVGRASKNPVYIFDVDQVLGCPEAIGGGGGGGGGGGSGGGSWS